MDKQTITIDLPKAMLYYPFPHPLAALFPGPGYGDSGQRPHKPGYSGTGAVLAIDEAYLSLKIYLGHVAALMGKYDQYPSAPDKQLWPATEYVHPVRVHP